MTWSFKIGTFGGTEVRIHVTFALLLLWIWFMIQLVLDPIRVLRQPGSRDPQSFAAIASVAAVGSWLALLVAGMFEYNFGDSEVLTLFLFIMSAPNAARVNDEPA